MDAADKTEVKTISELTIRQFFDHYLDEVFPGQLDRIIRAHNADAEAHASQILVAIRHESYRVRLWLIGLVFAVGLGGGAGVAKVIAAIAG